MTALESAGKSAMHSETVRRGWAGAWITATGRFTALDHDFRAGAHTGEHVGEVAGGFRFRDTDHMVGHGASIRSFPSFSGFGVERRPRSGFALVILRVLAGASLFLLSISVPVKKDHPIQNQSIRFSK